MQGLDHDILYYLYFLFLLQFRFRFCAIKDQYLEYGKEEVFVPKIFTLWVWFFYCCFTFLLKGGKLLGKIQLAPECQVKDMKVFVFVVDAQFPFIYLIVLSWNWDQRKIGFVWWQPKAKSKRLVQFGFVYVCRVTRLILTRHRYIFGCDKRQNDAEVWVKAISEAMGSAPNGIRVVEDDRLLNQVRSPDSSKHARPKRLCHFTCLFSPGLKASIVEWSELRD